MAQVLERPRSGAPVVAVEVRRRPWLLDLYASAVGKKYVMAVSGIVLMGYVLVHMIGNLHVYEGAHRLNEYAESLRDLGESLVGRTRLLWAARTVLIAAFVLHLHAAYGLTRINRRARAEGGYLGPRHYVAVTFASRTMRWTGVIVILFVVFHLLDLTWGTANPEFVRGDVYGNLVASFERVPVAIAYIVANLALGLHLYHGAWSLFQSLGWSHPRFNHLRRWFAVAFALVVTAGNVSFPVAVQTGIVG